MEHFKSSKQSAGESSIERDRLYWTKVGINPIQPVGGGGGGGGEVPAPDQESINGLLT